MHYLFKCLFVVLLTFSTLTVSENVVQELTSDSIHKIFDGKDAWFVFFYMNECPACQAFKSNFDEIAQTMDVSFKYKLNFAKVNINANRDLASKFVVTHVPMFYFVYGNEAKYYKGNIEISDIEDYIASEKWKQDDNVHWLIHPNSMVMEAFARMTLAVDYAFQFKEMLEKKYKLTETQSTGVLLLAAFLFSICTAVFTSVLILFLANVFSLLFSSKRKEKVDSGVITDDDTLTVEKKSSDGEDNEKSKKTTTTAKRRVKRE